MSDILPVRMQDILHCWKPELRKQQPVRDTGSRFFKEDPYGRMIVGGFF